ncbi:hypothetical protein Tco_1559262, partial [Tanacetum coccineum]
SNLGPSILQKSILVVGLASADSVPPVHHMTARISIRDEPSIFLLGKSHEVGESSTADAARQDRLAIARDDPYSIAREDLYGFVDMVDVPPRCSAAGAARQDRPAIARDNPYSIAREDLYGFVDVVDVPPRCLTSRELDYDIMDTWDDLVGAIDEIAPTTLEGVNQRVTDLSTIVEQETTVMIGIKEEAPVD